MHSIIKSQRFKIDSLKCKLEPRGPKLTSIVKKYIPIGPKSSYGQMLKIDSHSITFGMTGTMGYFFNFGMSRSVFDSF